LPGWRRVLVLAVGGILGLCALALVTMVVVFSFEPTYHLDFSGLAAVDEVRVGGGKFPVYRGDKDAATVRVITTFIQDRSDGWKSPWYGVPVGSVTVRFLSAGQFTDVIDIGPGFMLVGGSHGGFYVRQLSEAELAALLGLMSMTRQDLRQP
jgi:hypothetical protein